MSEGIDLQVCYVSYSTCYIFLGHLFGERNRMQIGARVIIYIWPFQNNFKRLQLRSSSWTY